MGRALCRAAQEEGAVRACTNRHYYFRWQRRPRTRYGALSGSNLADLALVLIEPGRWPFRENVVANVDVAQLLLRIDYERLHFLILYEHFGDLVRIKSPDLGGEHFGFLTPVGIGPFKYDRRNKTSHTSKRHLIQVLVFELADDDRVVDPAAELPIPVRSCTHQAKRLGPVAEAFPGIRRTQ